MKNIDVSTKKHPNTFVTVDDDEYEKLNIHKWTAAQIPGSYVIYAVRGENGTQIKMHREIMGFPPNHIDHRDGNGLNNQKSNIRNCTFQENMASRGITKSNNSGFKGVCWSKQHSKWQAQIGGNRNRDHLGFYFCIIKAAKAYDTAAKAKYKLFAILNFPEVD